MAPQDDFDRQLKEILDFSSGETHTPKEVAVPHGESPQEPVITAPAKRFPVELLIRIAAFMIVLYLLFSFGLQIAHR